MFGDAYKPGERSQAGIILGQSLPASHHPPVPHRFAEFPTCNECGDKVRFEPAAFDNEPAEPIFPDRDFFRQP